MFGHTCMHTQDTMWTWRCPPTNQGDRPGTGPFLRALSRNPHCQQFDFGLWEPSDDFYHVTHPVWSTLSWQPFVWVCYQQTNTAPLQSTACPTSAPSRYGSDFCVYSFAFFRKLCKWDYVCNLLNLFSFTIVLLRFIHVAFFFFNSICRGGFHLMDIPQFYLSIHQLKDS